MKEGQQKNPQENQLNVPMIGYVALIFAIIFFPAFLPAQKLVISS